MAAARVDGIDRLMQALSTRAAPEGRVHPALGPGDAPRRSSTRRSPGQAILYVQAGALTNVVIAEDGEPLLVRAASAGSEAIAQGLAERAQISHEEARAHIAALGVRRAPHHGAPATISPELEAAVSLQVREGLRRVIAEIQSSRGFYSARPDAAPDRRRRPDRRDDDLARRRRAAARRAEPAGAAGGSRQLAATSAPSSVAPERLDVAVGLRARRRPTTGPTSAPRGPAPSKHGRRRPERPRRAGRLRRRRPRRHRRSSTWSWSPTRSARASEQIATIGAEIGAGRAAGRGAQAVRRLRARRRSSAATPVTKVAKARFNWDRMLVRARARRPRRRLADRGQGARLEPDLGRRRRRRQPAARRLPGSRRSSSPAAASASATSRSTWIASTRSAASATSASTARSAPATRTAARPARAPAVKTASSFSLVTYFEQSPELAALAAPSPGAPRGRCRPRPAPPAAGRLRRRPRRPRPPRPPAAPTTTTPAGATK